MLQYQSTKELAELVSRLEQAVATDKIFLLGQSVEGLPVNSIFRPIQHGNETVTGYYLLLLTRHGEHRSDDVIQDMLEQRNKFRTPVHLMVYPVKSFYQWLQAGQFFAMQVNEKAPILYNAGITKIPEPGYALKEQNMQKQEEQVKVSFQHANAFLTGANLFIESADYDLAAFLLHQATEHACLSFLLQHTGLRTGTHNIDKLLRYSTMINNVLINIFPRATAEDIELFRLLQKAYIHSRYKDGYTVSEEQIRILAERVKKLIRRCAPDQDRLLFRVEEETVPWTFHTNHLKETWWNVRSSVPAMQAGYDLQDQYQQKDDNENSAYGKINSASAKYFCFFVQ